MGLVSGVSEEEVYGKRLWRKERSAPKLKRLQIGQRTRNTRKTWKAWRGTKSEARCSEAQPRRCSTYRGSTETFVVCSPRDIRLQNVWCFVNDEPQRAVSVLKKGGSKPLGRLGRAEGAVGLNSSGASSVDNKRDYGLKKGLKNSAGS
jgi:hypothetical protein